jgi:hypothetical protein
LARGAFAIGAPAEIGIFLDSFARKEFVVPSIRSLERQGRGPSEGSGTTTFFDFDVVEEMGTSFRRTTNGNDSLFQDFEGQILGDAVPADSVFFHMHRLGEISQSNAIAANIAILFPG